VSTTRPILRRLSLAAALVLAGSVAGCDTLSGMNPFAEKEKPLPGERRPVPRVSPPQPDVVPQPLSALPQSGSAFA
jgi:hypothetical protein